MKRLQEVVDQQTIRLRDTENRNGNLLNDIRASDEIKKKLETEMELLKNNLKKCQSRFDDFAELQTNMKEFNQSFTQLHEKCIHLEVFITCDVLFRKTEYVFRIQ